MKEDLRARCVRLLKVVVHLVVAARSAGEKGKSSIVTESLGIAVRGDREKHVGFFHVGKGNVTDQDCRDG